MPVVDYKNSKTYLYSVFDSSGAPQTGLSGTWIVLTGADSGITIPSSYAVISEISNGLYKTTIDWSLVVADQSLYEGEEVVGVIDWGVSLTAPERYTYTSFNTRDYDRHQNFDVLTSTSDSVEVIKEIQTGKWEIDSNQLKLYKSDNTTVIATFDLYDKNGSPTNDAPYSRVKV
jgi:hypothetical protein